MCSFSGTIEVCCVSFLVKTANLRNARYLRYLLLSFQLKMMAGGYLGSDRDSETAAFVNLARRGSVSSGTPKRSEERIKLSVHGICPVGQLPLLLCSYRFDIFTMLTKLIIYHA